MPDNNSDHDTEAAPTEQASPPTTELPPANHAAAESVHAWSLDDIAEIESDSPRRGRWLSAGLASLVVVVAAALIYLAATFFGAGKTKHVEQSALPSPTTTVRVAAPPAPPAPTVTVTAAPPVTVTAAPPTTAALVPTSTSTPAPALSSTDQDFLTDIAGSFPSGGEYAIQLGHIACSNLRITGNANHTMDFMMRVYGLTEMQAIELVNAASGNYCKDAPI